MDKRELARALRRANRPTIAQERFWAKVDRSAGGDGCWLWMGAQRSHGYGVTQQNTIRIMAHRAAWIFVNGPIPDGLNILHRCDTPLCVNVKRCLFLGTQADNVADMISKGRQAKGEAKARHGAKHGCAKLADAQYLEMAVRRLNGESCSSIGIAFGVSATSARNAFKRYYERLSLQRVVKRKGGAA